MIELFGNFSFRTTSLIAAQALCIVTWISYTIEARKWSICGGCTRWVHEIRPKLRVTAWL